MTKNILTLPENYPVFLKDIKNRIQQSQIKAAISVNQELIKLHWWIGSEIVKKQEAEGWKAQVIDRLCKDIQSEFPGLKGFSRSNVFYMRTFYISYVRVQQAVGLLEIPPQYCLNIPWGHNVILLNKVKDLIEREWYAKATIEHGWSRSMLELWIESNLYQRQSKAPNNFQKTLPSPQSDLAEQVLKDPYNLDFIAVLNNAREKEIENSLMIHMQKFLLELGHGFAFVGRQVPLRVGGENYLIDLLFYHIKLKSYFILELKAVSFRPEFVGQLNFYLSVVDDKMRGPGDNPSIGLILCRNKNEVTVKYALDRVISPIGVAGYETALAESIPEDLSPSLPTIEEIETETILYTERMKLQDRKSNQMKYKDYIGVIEYEDEKKIFLGKVIDINEALTFQGRSIEELEAAFKDSVEEHLVRNSLENNALLLT